MNLYLDDVRSPPDDTWTIARTAATAKILLATGRVEYATLDHDIGICPTCTPGTFDPEVDIVVMQSLDAACKKGCRCACHETGYDLVKWMAETGNWPKHKPLVHSANPVGRRNMVGMIERYFPG